MLSRRLANMSCPFLKEVVMLYCGACSMRKMLPLDRIATASPCLAEDFLQCPMYQDAAARRPPGASVSTPVFAAGFRPGKGREVVQ